MENQTNIEEVIQQLEQSQSHIMEEHITEKEVQPLFNKETQTLSRTQVVPYIMKEIQSITKTDVDPQTKTIIKNMEIVEYVPYIQNKNGQIVPYEKKNINTSSIPKEKNINSSTKLMETIIAINFISLNYNINYPMACRKTDIFANIEEKLYREFPSLKSKKIYFMANGNIVNRSSTFEQNKIKNGNTILINEIE